MEEARDSLPKAARRMQKFSNRKKRPLEFNMGDRILLKLTPQIWKEITSKTAHKGLVLRYGPFEVLQPIENSPAPPVREQFDKKVEQILDHKVIGCGEKSRRVDYLVAWKRKPIEEATMEFDTTLWQFEKEIKDYWEQHLTRTSGSPGGVGL
ncbi:hypothetical protein RJ641_027574 [Dillenia turbinata]|uniref:Chromo domain-containing protein n=1 Tax=Dillenia turbinata TaxID=194707 RepID=A0AAN8ZLS4_9MAGN